TAAELGAFLHAVAPAPDEVRARGGVLAQLSVAGVTRIKPVEVDLAALYRGELTNLDELAGDDAVAQLAVRRALQLEKRGRDQGQAIAVQLSPSAGAAELGTYLDELVLKARKKTRRASSHG